MKKIAAFAIALTCAFGLAACGADTLSDLPEDTAKQVKETSDADEDLLQYAKDGYYLSLPADYRESILVNPEDNEYWRENALFEIYYKPAYEQGRAKGFDSGHLFTVLRLNRADYEQYLVVGDWATEYAFARDESYYYIMVLPNGIQVLDMEDLVFYTEVLELCRPAAIESMIVLNGLAAYDDSEFWESTETYDGEHIYYRYYPYRAYADVDTEENKDMFFTIMLSQPVRQGEDGIWCVERVYDAAEYGYIYAIFPKNGEFAAMETYTELQNACDSGENQELLNPMNAALAFVRSYYGHTEATVDSFEEVQGPPEGNFRF